MIEKKRILSLAIPTYNRASKLLRLLNNIEKNIIESELDIFIDVLISDNASTDDTQAVVMGFKTEKYIINYYRQDINIGFDGNIKFLYEFSETEYIWFFADDDIMLPNAINQILTALKEGNPDLILYSFIQPQGSEILTFNYKEKLKIVNDPKLIIENITKCFKISTYILRKINICNRIKKDLQHFQNTSFYFIALCFSVVSEAKNPILCIISNPLAESDEDYRDTRFPVSVYFNIYKLYSHPFVLKYYPNLGKISHSTSYYTGIQFMFAVKMKTISLDNQVQFSDEVKALKIEKLFLLKNPRALLQLFLIKSDLVSLYYIYKKILIKLKLKK